MSSSASTTPSARSARHRSTPQRQRGGERAPDITAAAVRLFAEHGYEQTSMDDIARALDIRASSLYNHVKSKRDILDAIGLSFVSGLREALASGLAMGSDVSERVARGIEEEVRFKLQHADEYVVMSRETLSVSPKVLERLLASRAEQRSMWLAVVEQGISEGVFSSPSAELSAMVLAELCSHLQVLHFVREKPQPEGQIIYWFGVLATRLLTP